MYVQSHIASSDRGKAIAHDYLGRWEVKMKAAFALWKNRMAPVFDTALTIRVIEADPDGSVQDTRERLSEEAPLRRVLHLRELGVEILICGAISRPLRQLVASYGIQVVPFIGGEQQDVVSAWLRGDHELAEFTMPGCRGQGRRRRGNERCSGRRYRE